MYLDLKKCCLFYREKNPADFFSNFLSQFFILNIFCWPFLFYISPTVRSFIIICLREDSSSFNSNFHMINFRKLLILRAERAHSLTQRQFLIAFLEYKNANFSCSLFHSTTTAVRAATVLYNRKENANGKITSYELIYLDRY